MEEGLLLKEREEERNVLTWDVVKEEVKKIGYLAGPMVAVTLSQFLLQLISMMMVGHLGELALSSAAIATSLTSVTGFSFLLGMAGALETLCGQAYGAQQYEKLGNYMYSAAICLILLCIPLSIIWVNMGKLLTFIGQDPLISLEAGKYAAWLIPALFAYATLQSQMRYLQSQSLILPMLLSSFAALCIHIPVCWFLVYKSALRTVGAALSIGIAYWLNVIILALYIKYSSSCEKTRVSLSKGDSKVSARVLRLAVPDYNGLVETSVLSVWTSSGFSLHETPCAHTPFRLGVLCLTTISFLYAIPFGVGAAASTRVANELGAGKPKAARVAVFVVMLLAATETTIVSSSLFLSRHILGYAYSNEKEVADYVTAMVPLICISVILDSLQGTLSGIARGTGWQHLGAYVNLGAFYLVGIPIAVLLSFRQHLGGRGLWIGILMGSVVQVTLLSLITGLTNWQQQAMKAKERISGGILSKENEEEE
ncbi:hypothetical protein IFM89_024383 [Coptis chinensis]|uniref:Protein DETOXIFICATION n=1 Tax=Coptis chinensis TaxID=261450 RepID=A0A835IUZ0_9MAGN|nr:hypothetical protein IFM89_024383 [Coptis chinensis]